MSNTIRDIENDVNDLSNRVVHHINRAKTKIKSTKCNGDKAIQNFYNCNSVISYHAENVNRNFTDCLTNADSENTIRKCIDKSLDEIGLLEKKIKKGKACSRIKSCIGNIGKIHPKTLYCFSHTQQGTGPKCMNKLKTGNLNKMKKADIDKMLGGTYTPPKKKSV